MEKNILSEKKGGLFTQVIDQLDRIIIEGQKLDQDDLVYYKAVRKLIDFELNEQEVKNQFKEFQDVMIGMGRLDFSRRVNIENTKDLFAYMGSALNMLNEELEEQAIPVEFMKMVLEHTMKAKPDFAILTNIEGKIQYVSKNPESIIGFSEAELKGQRVQNFIATKVYFLVNEDEGISEKEVQLFNSNSELIPVILSVVELNHLRVAYPSYLYMIKEKKG